MAAPQPRQLARLQIPPPMGQQQPFVYGDSAPMYSPSLPTAIQVGAHNAFPMHQHPNPLQTPMQTAFFPRQPPGAPPRPMMHRAHPSVVQLAAAGILPPGVPMTPLGQVGFPAPMLPPPFVPRSKRTQSVSTGGPPKAVLGGPQRKVSPLPPPIAAVVAATVPKTKKIIVNIPEETMREGEDKGTRKDWARVPMPTSEIPSLPVARGPDLVTAEPYPPDAWRHHLPDTIDVFLPGKAAWQAIKQNAIEEKLEKLGVERGSGSTIPSIHAPHTRAASISSPADPALLYFKLNKLQQSQNASASGSLAPSPQPPFNLSPSPGSGLPPRLQNRHGHSMSLAQAPLYNPSAAFNPFGPAATLGSDQILGRASPGVPLITATSEQAPLHAPQGRVPTNVSTLAPPLPLSRPESRPDFMRGFGVEIPEEEEPPEETTTTDEVLEAVKEDNEAVDVVADISQEEVLLDDGEDTIQDGVTTAAQSRIHSRHVSKLSAALSLRSVGGTEDQVILPVPSIPEMLSLEETADERGADDVDVDAVAEWTGSEDMRSDDESIGEWSNPSDEERARQDRLHRRMLRRTQQIHRDLEAPRRLPNFPRPPEGFVAHPDDDVISNPSDEEDQEIRDHYIEFERAARYSRPASNHSTGLPLPPLPHSRSSSAHFSYHDPALAHSREASDHFAPGGLHPRPATGRTESLNPLAKPFVFGGSFSKILTAPGSTSSSTPSHTRAPSLGKPLNVAAPEFKPGGFTFKPPPGVPQLAFSPAPASSIRPLPAVPTIPIVDPSPVRATQGREKRQRTESRDSYGDEEGTDGDIDDANDTMTSFKFPPAADQIKVTHRSAPSSPPAPMANLDNASKTFTFAGFSSAMAFTQDDADLPDTLIAHGAALDAEGGETLKAAPSTEPQAAHELPFPPTAKPKRAPIPLDFKHPISTNTVPAGLFKALVNGDDERTRRSVRSRLSSRDVFEHSPRPSLDDLSVPPISQRKTRNRLFTDPGFREQSLDQDDIFDIPRRSSLPPRRGRNEPSDSDISLGAVNLERRAELEQYEQRLEVLLDEKIASIRKALEDYEQVSSGQGLNTKTESMISEVVSLFRAQLQDSAARNLEDSQRDARGEFDFGTLKDIIEQSQAESRNIMQRDLDDFLSAQDKGADFKRFADDLCERTVKAVLTATSQITMHLHTIEQNRGSLATERDQLLRDIVTVLKPTLSSIRPEPIDYEGLTTQLSQAVKPHISQLIDLASDKRETAGLIVDRLIPILPSIYPPTPAFDMDTVVGRLSLEMRKIIGPLDAHEIKEQVSDLVVERLDSRLAVRDRAFNVEVIKDKVTDSVKMLLQPLEDLKSAVEVIRQKQDAPAPPSGVDTADIRQDINALLADLPTTLSEAVSSLDKARSEFKSEQERIIKTSEEEDMHLIRDTLDQVADEQKRLVSQNLEFSEFCQDIIKHINALPEAMVEATKVLQSAHADIISRDTSQKDAEEIRRLLSANAELQVQLAKARGAHGQVRVEKDNLADRLRAVESEREEFRSKLAEAEALTTEKTAVAAAAEARTAELEQALSQALDRIKSSDVVAQNSQERISSLEKTNGDLLAEKQLLQAKVDKLDMSSLIANREKEAFAEELASLKKQNQELASQQSHWDELRHTSEQIQALAALISQGDSEEIQDLKRVRDKYRTLESEHTALQRRFKDQDNKMANSERAALAARQSLSNAQQRAVEWEKRAKDGDHEIASLRARLEDAEQMQGQLEADFSMAKVQLEERDAEERLIQDRESKLRDQIAALEGQLARVQAEADRANAAAKIAKPTSTNIAARTRQNGYTRPSHTPARPDSRASTIDPRAVTPVAQINGSRYTPSVRASTPPQESVWDSIHAPAARRGHPLTTKAIRSNYRQIPSPTPSNVSAAPTLGNDGWWS